MPLLTRLRASPVRRAVPVAVLVLVVLVLFRDVLFAGRAFFDRDVEHFLYERLYAFQEAVRGGELPLWNPYPAFGEPSLTVANAEFAYPTTWLAALLPPDVTDTVIVVLHTLLGGLGVLALAGELGISPLGAATGAALWSVSGPLQSCADQANMLVGAAWIPWAWLGFARWGRLGGRRNALGIGLALGLSLLGGSPESAFTGGLGIVLALRAGVPGRGQLTRLGRATALALVVALGLSAVQWLPTATQVPRSVRAQATRADRESWSNHPASLAQLVMPLPWDDLPVRPVVRDVLFSGREPLLYSLYLGLSGLGLALAAAAGPARRGRGWLLALSVAGFALSLGRHSLVWEVASRIPPLTLVRYPARFSVAGALPLAVLAGMGLDALRSGEPDGRRRFAAIGAVVGGAVLALAWASHPEAGLWRALLLDEGALGFPWLASHTFVSTLRHLALGALLAAPLLLALALRAAGRTVPALLVVAAAAAAVVDPLSALTWINPTVPRDLLLRDPPSLALIPRTRPNRTYVVRYPGALARTFLGVDGPGEHVYDSSAELRLWLDRYYPFDSMGTPGRRIESLPGDVTNLRDQRINEFVAAVDHLLATPAFPRLLERAGIDYVVAQHDLSPADFELLSTAQGRRAPIRTYRVRQALPRAFAVAGARVADGPAAFALLADPAFDPRSEVLLARGSAGPPGPAGVVRVSRLGFTSLELEADLPAPGHVVVLEAWAPGWRAAVDGRPTPIERANLLFRAVAVPAGRHRIWMRYRPWEPLAGGALSLITVVAAAAGWRRARPGV